MLVGRPVGQLVNILLGPSVSGMVGMSVGWYVGLSVDRLDLSVVRVDQLGPFVGLWVCCLIRCVGRPVQLKV